MNDHAGGTLRTRIIVAALLLAIVPASPGEATPAPEIISPDATVTLAVHRGHVIRLGKPAAAVFVADPDVADVQAHSPSLIYLMGRRAGTTTLYAVDDQEHVLLRSEVVVQHDLASLRAVLAEIAPGDAPAVRSIEGGLLLDGAVTDPRAADDVREAAARFLGKEETLINHLSVSGSTQVGLQVRIAEVSRDAFRLLGINLQALFTPGDFVFGLLSGRPLIGGPGGRGFPGPDAAANRFADVNGAADTLLGGFDSGHVNINGVVDALERDGLVNVLAEPNLTALSGETASFLAGGEFPVPVGVDDNDIAIEFKPFGVSLAFTPTVLSANRISLRVRPEVSELSDNGAIKISGLVIPALATRRAETTVELGSGQSFAIGGLISSSTRSSLERFPGLGDLPVLGALFRSTNFRHQESELVIIVTPYLVRPVPAQELTASLADGLALPRGTGKSASGSATSSLGLPPGLRLAGPAGFVLD